MNRYLLIRRLRLPVVVLLIGTLALLHQMGVIAHFWRLSWPLAMIAWGLLALAERAALTAEEEQVFPAMPWPGVAQGTNQAATPGAANAVATTSTAIVPSHPHDIERINERGQS